MFRSLILAAVLALGGALAAQQPAPFKGGTRTVAVYATVTDQSGRLVPDLGRDDFEIDDNGKRQEISVFANDIQPITVVMMLDRSGSMQSNFRLVANAAEQFVTDLLPADKARIGSFSNRIQVDPRDFTSDHNELIEILRTELQEAGPTPLWNAVNVGITALLHQKGRRVILVFTDGVDFPMNSTSSSLKDVMKRAEEEDVMVYAIGLAGRSFAGGRRGGRGGGFGRGGRGGGYGGYGGGRRPTPEKPDEGLPKIATATGGGYFELTSTADLSTTFARVANELHHQYVLGFTPPVLDGKMHKLDVHIKRPGMAARARKSYLASAEK
jgi:Ca-activated chloride channel family protein